MTGKAYQSRLRRLKRRLPNGELNGLRFHIVEAPVIFMNGSESKSIRPRPSASLKFGPRGDGCTHCHRCDGCGTRLVACNKRSGVQASHRATGKYGPSEGSEDYRFICYSPLATGHRMNASLPRGLCTSPVRHKRAQMGRRSLITVPARTNQSFLRTFILGNEYDLMRVSPEERKEFECELDRESLNHNKNQLSNFPW